MKTLLLALGIPLLLYDGQSAQSSHIPACPPLPDEEKNYPDNMVRPHYPKDALRKGESGNVEVKAVISPDGATKNLVVLSGDPKFSQPAVDAIRRWRFHAVSSQGRPVETTFTIHVRFNFLLREANSDVELESPQPEEPEASPSSTPHIDFIGDVHRMAEPGVVDPKAVYKPDPESSEASRKSGKEGSVVVALVVGSDGLPRDLRIICSSIPDNNENAMATLRKWKFAPGTKDGNPVAVAVEVQVDFHDR
jgi:TonB family protein